MARKKKYPGSSSRSRQGSPTPTGRREPPPALGRATSPSAAGKARVPPARPSPPSTTCRSTCASSRRHTCGEWLWGHDARSALRQRAPAKRPALLRAARAATGGSRHGGRRARALMRGAAQMIALLALGVGSATAAPRARDLGVPFEGVAGPLDAITDVTGVEVGHVTLIDGAGPLHVG